MNRLLKPSNLTTDNVRETLEPPAPRLLTCNRPPHRNKNIESGVLYGFTASPEKKQQTTFTITTLGSAMLRAELLLLLL